MLLEMWNGWCSAVAIKWTRHKTHLLFTFTGSLKASPSPSLIKSSPMLRLSTFIGCQQAFDSHNSPHGEFIKCQAWKKMFIIWARRVEDFSYSLILPPIMKNVFRSEFRWPKIFKFPHHLLSLAWSLQGSTRSLCYHHYQVQICQQAVRNLMKY